MKTAVFEYKCRRCGKVFDGCETAADRAYDVLVQLEILGNSGPGIPMRYLSWHDKCRGEGTGVGDLIGYRIEEQ